MKTPAPMTRASGGLAARSHDTGRRFDGVDSPRALRALHALLVSPRPREAIDRIAGCSNGPDLVADLRARGLDVPCERTPIIDRDGHEVRRGVYALTNRDRARVRAWLRERERAASVACCAGESA